MGQRSRSGSADVRRRRRKKLMRRYKGRCCACGQSSKDMTVDHVVPLSQGGTNSMWNLQLLCGPCNSEKGNSAADYRPG